MSHVDQARIFKILTPEQWSDFQSDGIFRGAPIDIVDGYIHLSTGAQVEETAAKHFSSHRSIIVCLCDSALMDHELKWEPSRGGDLFPHLYDPLPIVCVIAHSVVTRKNQAFAILDNFAQEI
jgi:uncharacterized protein (DUF952 family)